MQHVFLQAVAPFDGQELYRRAAVAVVRRLRYKGCFTDGGVDEGRIQYWVTQTRAPC